MNTVKKFFVILIFPLSFPAVSHADILSGLVGYWTFDGKDTNWNTNKTNDLSGNGNIGTMVSMSTTTSPVVGKIGRALRNLSSGYMTVPNSSSIDLNTSMFLALT